jgi:hypothetical protein
VKSAFLKLIFLSSFFTTVFSSTAQASLTCGNWFQKSKAAVSSVGTAITDLRGGVVIALKRQENDRLPSEIPDSEISQIKSISEKIVDWFPSKKYLYAGTGRSPTPFTAYLKAAGYSDTINIPLTSMRNHPQFDDLKFKKRFSRSLTPEQEARLFKHFDRFLPRYSQLQGRDLLLIDYVQSGASLIAAREYITRYYQSRGEDVNVVILALIDPTLAKSYRATQIKDIPQIEIPRGDLLYSIAAAQYDSISEFSAFVLSDSSFSEERNPRYDDLVEEFKKRVRN